jgi:DNA-binding LacI/PurR family transcriptional regulator
MKRKSAPAATVELAPGERPTSYHVAKLAGVSQSAVSRAFRPGKSIAPATRKRIADAAATLGYQPNAIASGLITKRSNMVAVLISNLTNLYYPEVLSELTSRLSARGIRVLLFTLANESDADDSLDQVWRYRVDGAIAAVRLSPEQIGAFARHQVPVVLYNRYGEGVPSVCCDSIGGERQLIDALVAAGHRRFGIIAGPEDSYVGRQRVDSARDRLTELNLKVEVAAGGFDYSSGQQGLAALIEAGGGPPDVVVCANDLMAIGAIDAARLTYKLDVPGELSVVGFDGVEPASWASYALTTVRQPVGRMTEAAVAMLIERIEERELPPEVRTFAGQIIRGRSARLGG